MSAKKNPPCPRVSVLILSRDLRRPPPPPPSVSSALRLLRPPLASQDQHRIAVAVEPVATRDCLSIGGQDPLAPGERRNEHQQRRRGQMEVGEQAIDGAELVPRVHE